MADTKISGLPASTVPLAGTEVLPIVQSSTTKQVSIANVTAGRAVSALSLTATADTTPSSSLGAFNYGTLTYADVNHLATFQTTVNNYAQVEIQNSNVGATASADMVVGNNNTTASTYYGDFGMNSSGWIGSGPFNTANAVYLTSTTAPLSIGTTDSNIVNFATNSTTAASISTAQIFSTVNDATIHTLTVGLGGGAVSTSTAFGYQALNATVTGTNNLAIGYQAGKAITSGASNVAIGSGALATNTGGNSNVCIGNGAGNNTTGSSNLAIGAGSLNQNTVGSGSVAVGTSALNQSTGASNTAIGVQAGYGNASANANTTGANNTFIGYQTVGSANNNTNAIVIGYQGIGLGSNTTVIGNSSTTATYNGNNSATWSITSDARIKKNIISLTSGIDVISALRPVEFDYIENDKHDVGFIAQEYQTVLPAQVIEQDNGMLGLNQNLIPYLVKALQELNAKFDAYVASQP